MAQTKLARKHCNAKLTQVGCNDRHASLVIDLPFQYTRASHRSKSDTFGHKLRLVCLRPIKPEGEAAGLSKVSPVGNLNTFAPKRQAQSSERVHPHPGQLPSKPGTCQVCEASAPKTEPSASSDSGHKARAIKANRFANAPDLTNRRRTCWGVNFWTWVLLPQLRIAELYIGRIVGNIEGFS